MLIELSKATDIIRAEMRRVHHLYGASYTYVVLMRLLADIEELGIEPNRNESNQGESDLSDYSDPRYYELKRRRAELFNRLGATIEDKSSRGKLILYIFELWKYIADVHGEEFSIEVDKDVLDGEDEDE
jgi:hypothetical protein